MFQIRNPSKPSRN